MSFHLPVSVRLRSLQLIGEVEQFADTLCRRDVLHTCEVVEHRRIDLWLNVVVIVGEQTASNRFNAGRRDDQSCIWIGFGVDVEPVECIVQRRVLVQRVDGRASPHQALIECLEVHSGDDAEVVASTPKGKVKVGVGSRVGVDDLAICKYDLVVLYVVTSPSMEAREERDATFQESACWITSNVGPIIPPKGNPPTPMSPLRPPITARFIGSSFM